MVEAIPRVFRLMLLASLVAVAAAVVVDDKPRPGIALGSDVLHRVLVGFGVLAVGYAILMVLWLAYQGPWASMQMPAVGAGIQPADQIDQAADSLEELRNVVQERLGSNCGIASPRSRIGWAERWMRRFLVRDPGVKIVT